MVKYVVFFILLLAGCATSYQQQSFTGGFSETQLSENIFQVNFKGNGYTSRERASDFALLRSAEITLENGYKYFALVDTQNTEKTALYQTPITAHTTGNVNTFGTVNNYGSYGTYNGSSYGTATTTFSGGQINTISKPRSSNTIICFKDKPKDTAFVFDAEFVKKSIRTKYELDKEEQSMSKPSADEAEKTSGENKINFSVAVFCNLKMGRLNE